MDGCSRRYWQTWIRRYVSSYLFDENKEYLLQKAAWGPKNPISFDIQKPIKLKPGLGIVGDVARTGIGEIVSDTSKDERYFLDGRISIVRNNGSYNRRWLGELG